MLTWCSSDSTNGITTRSNITYSSKSHSDVKTAYHLGVSEMAKRKLGRTSSQGSTDPSRETSPSDTPEHKRPPQRPPPPNIQKSNATNQAPPTSNFFETLDWHESNEPMLNDEDEDADREEGHSEQHKHQGINQEGYSTVDRNSINQEPTTEKLFNADFHQVPQSSEPETVDLLNLGGDSSQSITSSMNLLDIGSSSEPSNVDLLSGAVPSPVRSANQSPVPQPSVNLLGDTFDPFQQVAASSQPQPQTAQPNAFDPFGISASEPSSGLDEFGMFHSSTEAQPSQKSTGKTDDFLNFIATPSPSQTSAAAAASPTDLIGGWNTGNLSSSASNPPASVNTQSSINSSAFGNLGTAMGMPRNASGTTLGMAQGTQKPNVGMPRNNSGPNLGGSTAAPPKPADPFADLGK